MTASADELWLGTLQRLTAHIAHDLKGALNAASVNLEVVRSRSERETLAGADIQRFATNATEQLSTVIRVTGALLSLGRGPRGPVDASLVARQLVNLIDGMASPRASRITLEVEGGMAVHTRASLSAVRVAIGQVLLSALEGPAEVSVRVSAMPTPQVRISPAAAPSLSDDATEAFRDSEIRLETDGHGISILLPGPPDLPH